ncbi:MAG: hypothetical protein U9O89_02830 [Thermoproteota archaeon]|nr:hypothetical protein [Thermoproteota archaeon]
MEISTQLFTTINKVFGDENISPLFERVAGHEKSLFSLLPFYRDHIVHSIRVFLTGLYLLRIENLRFMYHMSKLELKAGR